MLLSRSSILLALTLVLCVSARPYEKKRWGGWGGSQSAAAQWWQRAPTSSSFGEFGKRMPLAATTCDLSSAVNNMNLAAASPPLPAPAAGLSLFQVVVGRGTQNYTCDASNATATPVPIGAVATLFDISCVAALAPELLSTLSKIALDFPVPTTTDAESPIMQDMTGHHYFLDSTTPFFNLDTAAHNYGMGALAKANASNAPDDSYAGPNGQGNGAVQWLKLDAKPTTAGEDSWKQVYRLDTAGGTPPSMCTGQPASFEVPYSAVYWLFK